MFLPQVLVRLRNDPALAAEAARKGTDPSNFASWVFDPYNSVVLGGMNSLGGLDMLARMRMYVRRNFSPFVTETFSRALTICESETDPDKFRMAMSSSIRARVVESQLVGADFLIRCWKRDMEPLETAAELACALVPASPESFMNLLGEFRRKERTHRRRLRSVAGYEDACARALDLLGLDTGGRSPLDHSLSLCREYDRAQLRLYSRR